MRRLTCNGVLVLGEGAVHLDELLADGGVDGDLLAEHLHLLVGHHLDVPPEPFPASAPLVRRGGGRLGPVPPLHSSPAQADRPAATGKISEREESTRDGNWESRALFVQKEIGRLGRQAGCRLETTTRDLLAGGAGAHAHASFRGRCGGGNAGRRGEVDNQQQVKRTPQQEPGGQENAEREGRWQQGTERDGESGSSEPDTARTRGGGGGAVVAVAEARAAATRGAPRTGGAVPGEGWSMQACSGEEEETRGRRPVAPDVDSCNDRRSTDRGLIIGIGDIALAGEKHLSVAVSASMAADRTGVGLSCYQWRGGGGGGGRREDRNRAYEMSKTAASSGGFFAWLVSFLPSSWSRFLAAAAGW
nr:unnamed protein product [Digitaria exilis]